MGMQKSQANSFDATMCPCLPRRSAHVYGLYCAKRSLGFGAGVAAGGRGRSAGGGRPGGAAARQHGHLAHAGGLEGARPAAPAARRAAGARPS